jgi:hypothetical protein
MFPWDGIFILLCFSILVYICFYVLLFVAFFDNLFPLSYLLTDTSDVMSCIHFKYCMIVKWCIISQPLFILQA